MPMGDLRRAVRLEVGNPSQHGPHLFAQPTIYTWEAVRSGRRWGRRMLASDWENRSNNSGLTPMIRGGIHLTAPAFLPSAILKEMTATEEQFYKASLNLRYLLSAGLEDLRLEQQRLETFYYKPMYRGKFGNHILLYDISGLLYSTFQITFLKHQILSLTYPGFWIVTERGFLIGLERRNQGTRLFMTS